MTLCSKMILLRTVSRRDHLRSRYRTDLCFSLLPLFIRGHIGRQAVHLFLQRISVGHLALRVLIS